MLRSLKESVHALVSDAYHTLSTSTAPAGSTTTDENPAVSFNGETVKAGPRNKRKASPMVTESRRYTRSVGRFVEEFEAQEKSETGGLRRVTIESDKQNKIDGQEPSSGTNRTTPRRPDISGERRALGLPERSPIDATKIELPMAKPQAFLRRGAYNPQDTLTGHKSEKQRFYHSRTQKNTVPISTDSRFKDVARNQLDVQKNRTHDDNHRHPHKRQRIGSSPTYAINLDDSQDTIRQWDSTAMLPEFKRPSPSKRNLVNYSPDAPPIRVNIPPRSSQEGMKIELDPGVSSPIVLTRFVEPHSPGSPDELSQAVIAEPTLSEVRQRDVRNISPNQTNGSGGRIKQHLDSMLSSPSPPPKNKTKRNPSNLSYSTTNTPIQQRLASGDESPDALQGESTTSKNRKGSRSDPPGSRQVQSQKESTIIDKEQQNGKDVFPLAEFVYYRVPPGKEMVLVVDRDRMTFTLEFATPLLGEDPLFTLTINSIQKMHHDPHIGGVRRLTMLTNAEPSFRRLYAEFTNPKIGSRFISTVKAMNKYVTIEDRSREWMDNQHIQIGKIMRENGERDKKRTAKLSLHNVVSPKVNNYHPSGQTGVKRARSPEKTVKAQTLISGADRAGFKIDAMDDHPMVPEAMRTSSRTTRSQITRVVTSDDIDSTLVARRPSAFEKLKAWKNPLVYPPHGKRRETVQFNDLQRLDDDEFLNDNLVCLFIRYLEENTSAANMRKIHFFNSFLFASLTKDVKFRREINYDSVKKWTSKIDLFSRDFVVVPVNESYHWFLMIICNLSYFKTKHSALQEEEGENEGRVYEFPESAGPPVILESDLGETKNEDYTRSSFAEMSLDDQTNLRSSPTSKYGTSKKIRKKARRSLPKYDVAKPIIITLDSLGHGRSATATVLRQYIVAEANDKKGWQIDPNEIRGMTAKGIPEQNNFSDCGLYLCMYLEQFVLDPYNFVRQILQREDRLGWPNHIESSSLRDRLRNMLIELHNEQRSKDQYKAEIQPLGSILVNMNSPEHKDNTATTIGNMHVEKGRLQEKEISCTDTPSTDDSHDSISNDGLPQINSLDDWKQSVNQSISIDDDNEHDNSQDNEARVQIVSSPPKKKRKKITSAYFSKSDSATKPIQDMPTSKASDYHDPIQPAKYLERERDRSENTETVLKSSHSPRKLAQRSTIQREWLDHDTVRIESPGKQSGARHLRFKESDHPEPVEIDDEESQDFSSTAGLLRSRVQTLSEGDEGVREVRGYPSNGAALRGITQTYERPLETTRSHEETDIFFNHVV